MSPRNHLLRLHDILRLVLNAEHAAGLVPTGRRDLVFDKQVEIQTGNEFGVVLELGYGALRVQVPHFKRHVAAKG